MCVCVCVCVCVHSIKSNASYSAYIIGVSVNIAGTTTSTNKLVQCHKIIHCIIVCKALTIIVQVQWLLKG